MRQRLSRIRQNASGIAIEAFFRGLSAGGKLHPKAREIRDRVEITQDIPYRTTGNSDHWLDVYRPRDVSGPLPIVLHIHGGGFRILSKDTHWLMGLAFAKEGYLVFNINYRLAPQHVFPAAIEDACVAYQWVLDHAEEWGGDTTKLFIAGESAGANLVTGLTIASCFEREEPFARAVYERGHKPLAVLPFCGLLQATNLARYDGRVPGYVRDRMVQIENAYLESTPPRGSLADPLVVLEEHGDAHRELPPFFAPCGTADPILDDTVRLHRALERRGVPCVMNHYEDEVHAFHAFVFRRNARRCWRDAFAFMDGVLERSAEEDRSRDRSRPIEVGSE